MYLTKKITLAAILLLAAFFLNSDITPLWASEDLSRERALGKKVALQIEESWPVISDPFKVARVRMVFNRLIPYVSRPLSYDVKIVSVDVPNAFCIPGGSIYVTSAMLSFVRSDAELAAILGHELTHADKNHVMIQSRRSQKLSLATIALIIATEGKAAAAVMAGVAQIAITNSYSRDLEREADIGGVTKTYLAGYPAAAALTVMERLYEEQLKHPYADPGIFLDHPEISERIDNILQCIKDNNWPLSRKKALKLLRVKVVQTDDKGSAILIDRIPVWNSHNHESQPLFKDVAQKLNENLELETLPYDITLVNIKKDLRSLVIAGVPIVSEPLPPGTESIEVFRANIVELLTDVKRSNPVTNYLR